MKGTIRNVLIMLAIAMTLIVAQSAVADEVAVDGVITSISTRPNIVEVDGAEVYGVKLNYLCNQYNLCLSEGETVSLLTYEYTCSDGSTKLMGTSISVGDVTIQLR